MQSNINIEHEKNQVVTVSVDDKPKTYAISPPFACFGRSGTTSKKVEGINAALLFASLSNNASWLFWNLVNVRDYHTNLCEFLASELTQAEKLKLTRAYKELNEKGMIKRVRNQLYLINPKVILPEFERYQQIQSEWDRVKTITL